MIAAIGLNAAAIGVDGVDLRHGLCSEWVSSFEQNSTIVENVGWKSARRAVCQGKGFSACQIYDLDDKASGNLSRIDHSIVGQVERTNAIFGS